ncbi:GNAT family N-acetyltransferase [Dyella choica]|uniref:GNAT family N-acetyltransferase n=1 Tax=Dyella choica TaxID=1927959 RepID=UPI0013153D1A|nr:GNAT family N-acetyltransferase [Dyella choica]
MPVPTLVTERLILRGITEADAEPYERHFVDYEVIRHLSAEVPWPFPAGGVGAFIRDRIVPVQGQDRWVWGLHRQGVDGVIGAIDLRRYGERKNRGFWLGREFWGKGYMTEAVIRVNDFAFDELGFERLVFANAVGNERSRNVKLRTGARLVGVAPGAFVDPAYTRQEIWELTKEQWLAWRGR